MSGAIYTAADKDAALAKKAAADKAEQDYLEGLRRNESLPVGASSHLWLVLTCSTWIVGGAEQDY